MIKNLWLKFPTYYFDGVVNRGFIALYIGKIIVLIATGLLSLFLPVFIYNLFGQNFRYTAMVYAAVFALYFLLLAFGAKLLSRFGFRRALRASVFIGSLFYLAYFFMDETNYFYGHFNN